MEKILFIVNPLAGGKDKKAILAYVTAAIDPARFTYEVVYTQYAGHACEIARDCDADLVVAIGGDGTQNEVARGLIAAASDGAVGPDTAVKAAKRKRMGIIPCGSGDGLALHLGISRTPAKAARVLCEGKTVSIDYALVNGMPFLCTSGVGLDAIVSWNFSQAHSRGLHTYVLESIKAWFNFKTENYSIIIDGTECWNGPATLVTVGNANQWGNNAKITPLASLRDGLLDVTVVDVFHTWAFPDLLVKLMTGKAAKSRHATCFKGRKIKIIRDFTGPLHKDGDPMMEGREIVYSIVAEGLDMVVPHPEKL